MKVVSQALAFLCIGAISHALSAQTVIVPWLVRVYDIETSQPIPGVAISAPELANLGDPGVIAKGVTDKYGEVSLEVPLGAVGVGVLAEGVASHHYAVKSGDVDVPLTIFMAPYSAFHKSAVIPTSGTTNSIVFNGVRPSPAGDISYQILIDIPAGVLDAPSQIWMYPRPLWAASRSDNACWSPGEFHVELRDAGGAIAVRQRVNKDGLILRFTPFWLPGSEFPTLDQVVVDTRNLTTMGWDRDTSVGAWDPSTNLVTLRLNHFSGQECAFWDRMLRGLGFDTSLTNTPKPPVQPARPVPAQAPIPAPALVSIQRETCVSRQGSSSNGTIECGTYRGGGCSAGAKSAGSVEVSAGFEAEASSKLNVGTSGLSKLLGKLEAETGYRFQVNGSGGLTLSWEASAGKAWQQGDLLLSKYKCYTGELWLFAVQRKVSLVGPGGLSIGINIPDGVCTYVCLDYSPDCEGCTAEPGPGQGMHIATCIPPSQQLCAGQAPCQ